MKNLVANCKVKTVWQTKAEQFGKLRADRMVAKMFDLTVAAVRDARYYW